MTDNPSHLSKAKSQVNRAIESPQSSWYAKLHPIGTVQQDNKPKKLLNLSIFFRVWSAVALILILSGTIVFTQLFEHVKPTVQQVIEDTLLDTSKMMAASLQAPLQSGQLFDASYQAQLDTAFASQLPINKNINNDYFIINNEPNYKQKDFSSFRVYVTDNKGIVIYDSLPAPTNAEGQDYSRWNDVYLTLRGQYGARSTSDSSSLRDSSIMYVAQPITDNSGQPIGVVSIGKPIDSVLTYMDSTRQQMLITTLLISFFALILAGLVAWWLKQSISLVTGYTSALAEDTKKPYFYLGNELNSLTDSIESMKHRLENRAYVSDYVHTLTHELKSPLTAIRASSELLEDDSLDNEDRQMLNQAIGEQSIKIQQLIDRLLLLAKVEQPTFKLNRQPISLIPLLDSLVKNSNPKLQQRQLPAIDLTINHQSFDATTMDNSAKNDLIEKTTVYADSFWLVQALQNVLDNAIHFADRSVSFDIETSAEQVITLSIFNDGKPLPDYALTKVFDRYFSLSHHSQNNVTHSLPKKGTGLGLTLVKQVIEHHSGTVAISNVATTDRQAAGVLFNITLPLMTLQSPNQ